MASRDNHEPGEFSADVTDFTGTWYGPRPKPIQKAPEIQENLTQATKEPKSSGMETFAKDYVDQKFATERALSDTRFAEMMGEWRESNARTEGRLVAIEERIDGRFTALGERIEGRFAAVEERIEGRFSAIGARLDGLPKRWELFAAILTSVLAAIGIMVAVVSYGGGQFGTGAALSEQFGAIRDEQAIRDVEQDERLDQILEAIQSLRPPASE